MIACGKPTAIDGVILAVEAVSSDLCRASSQADVKHLVSIAREGGVGTVYLRVIKEETVSVYYDESRDAVVVVTGVKSMKLLDKLKVLRKDLNVLMEDNTLVLSESTGGLREVSLPLTPNSHAIAMELLGKLNENIRLAIKSGHGGFDLSVRREDDGRLNVNVSITTTDQDALERSITKLPSLLRSLEEMVGLKLLLS
jgi:hypothetical protein